MTSSLEARLPLCGARQSALRLADHGGTNATCRLTCDDTYLHSPSTRLRTFRLSLMLFCSEPSRWCARRYFTHRWRGTTPVSQPEPQPVPFMDLNATSTSTCAITCRTGTVLRMVSRTLDDLVDLALDHHGYVRAQDAMGRGIAGSQLRKLAASGRLEHVAHGLYRVAFLPRNA